MVRQPVSSSNVRSVGYDPESNMLEIEFNNSSVYQYFSVPENVYVNLIGTHSVGSYFHSHIKNEFRYQQVG